MTVLRILTSSLTIVGTILMEGKRCTTTITIKENHENEFYSEIHDFIVNNAERSTYYNADEDEYFEEVPEALEYLERQIDYLCMVLYDLDVVFYHDRIWLETDWYCEAITWETDEYSSRFCNLS